MRTLVLTGAWLRRSAIELRRYVFETVSSLVTLYGFFLVIFIGARAFGSGSPGLGGTLAGLVVGYAVWTLALYAYFAIAQGLVMEAQVGTLEQLAMSPFGLVRILLAQVVSGLVFQLGIIGALLVVMMATTGRWLHVDVVSVVPLAVFTILGIVGVGLAAGGLALVFKRVQSALNVFQVLLLGLVVTPLETVPWIKWLPLAWGTDLLRRVMIDGVSIVRMPLADLAFLLANSAVYLGAGIAVFKSLERVARDRGLLGHY